MNRTILLLLGVVLFSCNNQAADEKPAVTNASIPEQEKKLRDLVAQYPDSFQLANNLVDYFATNGDYGSAIKENNLLLKKYGDIPQLWDAKARLHFLNQDTAAAIKALENTVALEPRPEYIISLATIYAQTRNPAAIGWADTILAKSSGKGVLQATFIKGLYYSNAGETDKAISAFDECLKTDYTYMDAYREKAIMLYNAGKYLDALKVLELELSLSTTNEEAYYWTGRCFEKLGKKEQAIQNYQLAVQIDKDYAEAKDALAKLGVTP